MILAQEAAQGSEHFFGWYVGLGVGFLVIVVVVVIVASILALADKIGRQAAEATQALDDARVATLPLWDVAHLNKATKGIIESAQQARQLLEEART